MLKGIKGIVFDMDGVLTETSKAHFEAWRTLAESMGFDIPDEVEDHVRGISRLESLDIVLSYAPQTIKLSDSEKIEMATHKNNLYLDKIKSYTPNDLEKDVKALLEFLKSKQIKIALASASRNAPFLLEAMEISSFFDAVVDPNEIERGKPAPDIFLKACELIGLSPEVCLGVEDAQAGVESIKAAGLKAIGIGNLKDCDWTFESISKFYQTLLLDS